MFGIGIRIGHNQRVTQTHQSPLQGLGRAGQQGDLRGGGLPIHRQGQQVGAGGAGPGHVPGLNLQVGGEQTHRAAGNRPRARVKLPTQGQGLTIGLNHAELESLGGGDGLVRIAEEIRRNHDPKWAVFRQTPAAKAGGHRGVQRRSVVDIGDRDSRGDNGARATAVGGLNLQRPLTHLSVSGRQPQQASVRINAEPRRCCFAGGIGFLYRIGEAV